MGDPLRTANMTSNTNPGATFPQLNIHARIQDPLGHYTPATLPPAIEAFATEHGFISERDLAGEEDQARLRDLEEQPYITDGDLKGDHRRLAFFVVLKRGAELARRPKGRRKLSPADIAALDEEGSLLKQPASLYFTITMCSVGAALQGWDQVGSNSANLTWPSDLGLNPKGKSSDVWILGLVNAAPYFAAAFCGCWLSDPLNNKWGRRITIFFAGVFCFGSALGSAFVKTWPQLFLCRLLLGLGMGSKASTVPVLASESSPPQIRGSLVMSWQLWVAFGIFAGSTANLAVYQLQDAWRYQLGSAFLPAVPLLIGILMIPESPRWLIGKGRIQDGCTSLQRLRRRPVMACRDLIYIYEQLKNERLLLQSGGKSPYGRSRKRDACLSYLVRLKELWSKGRVRRATYASLTLMLGQQLCGINIMAFYSSSIFVEAKASMKTALLVSWGLWLTNFIFAFPAVHNIDKYGRRALLLVTYPGMAVTLAAAAASFTISEDNKARIGVIAFWIFLFVAFYSPGQGPVPFTYAAEAFDLEHRNVGMGLSVAVNLLFAGILTVVFPRMTQAMGAPGAIGLFAAFNVLSLMLIFFLVPETAKRKLEELNNIFNVPTIRFIRHKFVILSRFIPLMTPSEVDSLYNFSGDANEVAQSTGHQLQSFQASQAVQPKAGAAVTQNA